jgi:sn-glycerol 3-phosphate transport system substrate-binding protein
MKRKAFTLATFTAALAFGLPAQAQTEIQWWHSMSGQLGEWVNGLAKDFNASQTQYKVVPVFKGTYPESFAAAIAAFRAGNAPHVLQVFEVGTASMMASKGAIVPVTEIMQMGGAKFDASVYVPAVSGYYTAPNGQMLSFPFNSSTTVLHYNKDAFKAAGLDPNAPPKTWPEVALAAAKLKASGHKCPFTTSWQSWTQLESFSAWHNVEFATQRNGFNGLNTRLAVTTPLHVRHIENLANMAQQGLFVYKGRNNAADATFVSGECAMSPARRPLYGAVKRNAKFQGGIGTLPYYPDVPGAPQNTVIGGASLWVMNGKKPEEYKGVAEFFKYLSDARCRPRATRHRLPADHHGGLQDHRGRGFYKKNPGTDVSVTQMIRKTTDKSRGIRLGNFVQIRTIIDEELEQVWAGKKTAKEGLDDDQEARRRRTGEVREGQQGLSRCSLVGRPQGGAANQDCHPSQPLPRRRGGASQRTQSLAVEKRVRFKSWWLPWVLVAPQMVIVLVFFFWPAGQALYYSVLQQDAFGTSSEVRRAGELPRRCSPTTPTSRRSRPRRCSRAGGRARPDAVAAAGGDGRPRGQGLALLQDAADLALRGGAGGGRRAVAVHVRAVDRRRELRAARAGHRLEPPAQRHARDDPDRDGRGVEADLLQLPVLPGRAAASPRA